MITSNYSAVPAEVLADELRDAVAHFNSLPLHDHEGRSTAYLEVRALRERLAAAGRKPMELDHAA